MSKKGAALILASAMILASAPASAHRLLDPIAGGWTNFINWLF